MLDRRLQLTAAVTQLLFAWVLASGCSDSHGSGHKSVGAAYDALAEKIHECRTTRDACREDSDCSDAALATCEDAFHGCEDEARDAEKALRDATHACRIARETCEARADDDEDARAKCRDENKACMDTLKSPKPQCHADLEACLDEAREKDPPMPPLPEPMTEAEMACHVAARACMMAEVDAMRPKHACEPDKPTMPGEPMAGKGGKPEPDEDAGVDEKPKPDDAGMKPDDAGMKPGKGPKDPTGMKPGKGPKDPEEPKDPKDPPMPEAGHAPPMPEAGHPPPPPAAGHPAPPGMMQGMPKPEKPGPKAGSGGSAGA
jgi:hypothetical protein